MWNGSEKKRNLLGQVRFFAFLSFSFCICPSHHYEYEKLRDHIPAYDNLKKYVIKYDHQHREENARFCIAAVVSFGVPWHTAHNKNGGIIAINTAVSPNVCNDRDKRAGLNRKKRTYDRSKWE